MDNTHINKLLPEFILFELGIIIIIIRHWVTYVGVIIVQYDGIGSPIE